MTKKWLKRVVLGLCMIIPLMTSQFQWISVSAIPDNNEGVEITDPIQTPEDHRASNQDVMYGIINANPFDAGNPNQTQPAILNTTYNQQFSLNNNRVLKGIFSTAELYFSIPEYWDTKYVFAEIQYSVSKLITDKVPASLTFLVNDEPVDSCRISYQEGQNQVVYVQIPTKLLKKGYNSFAIAAYVKIFDYEGCSEEYSGANWLSVDAKSFVYAGYELKDYEHKISYYPYPFISTANPEGTGTSVLVSDSAANGELAAAMYLMADISTNEKDKNYVSLGYYKDAVALGAQKKIVISLSKNLPEDLKHFLKKNQEETGDNPELIDLSNRAMVHLTDDANGNPFLLIIADKEENLMEAVHMLLDDKRLSQEKVSTTFVNEGSSKLGFEAKKFSDQIDGNFTIKDISGDGLTFIGPFHQEKILYLPFKNNYVLSPAGKITLKFRYSENLDFNRSLMTIYWGDIPIASKKLLKENSAGDTFTLSMPVDVVGTSASSLKIAFDLEIPELFCTMRQDQMPWAYITEDSTLYLPAQANTTLSFGLRPFPYQDRETFNNVMVVTSDNPDLTELQLLGKAIALYGTDVAAYGHLKVSKASEFRKEDADYNIIMAGTYKNNSFLQSLNEKLSFKYNENGNAFLSNNRLILSDHYAQGTAAFQLLPSPYAKERAVFAICGTSQETLELALQFLETNKKRWELTGDSVLIDGDMEMQSFSFIEKSRKESKPSINEFVQKNKQSVIFTVMAAAAMIMLLMAAVIILIRAKIYKRKDD